MGGWGGRRSLAASAPAPLATAAHVVLDEERERRVVGREAAACHGARCRVDEGLAAERLHELAEDGCGGAGREGAGGRPGALPPPTLARTVLGAPPRADVRVRARAEGDDDLLEGHGRRPAREARTADDALKRLRDDLGPRGGERAVEELEQLRGDDPRAAAAQARAERVELRGGEAEGLVCEDGRERGEGERAEEGAGRGAGGGRRSAVGPVSGRRRRRARGRCELLDEPEEGLGAAPREDGTHCGVREAGEMMCVATPLRPPAAAHSLAPRTASRAASPLDGGSRYPPAADAASWMGTGAEKAPPAAGGAWRRAIPVAMAPAVGAPDAPVRRAATNACEP